MTRQKDLFDPDAKVDTLARLSRTRDPKTSRGALSGRDYESVQSGIVDALRALYPWEVEDDRQAHDG